MNEFEKDCKKMGLTALRQKYNGAANVMHEVRRIIREREAWKAECERIQKGKISIEIVGSKKIEGILEPFLKGLVSSQRKRK